MRRLSFLVVLISTAAAANQTSAQSAGFNRLFPHVRYFAAPVADPLEPRLGLGLMQTNLLEDAATGRERSRPLFIPDPDDAAFDVNAVTGIGGTLPFWQLKQHADGGIVLALQAGVHGRFRIEYPTREDVGQDWFVGLPIEMASGPWSGRLRFMHRSSHLGDELVETTGASRIEVGGEFVDFLTGYNFTPNTRVYGGGSWTFRSYTSQTPVLLAQGRHDRFSFQLGAETAWYPWVAGHLGWIAGLDWRRAERTGWQDSFAAAAGLNVKTATRGARFIVRYFSGASLLEQFFLSHEKYWSVELVTDF